MNVTPHADEGEGPSTVVRDVVMNLDPFLLAEANGIGGGAPRPASNRSPGGGATTRRLLSASDRTSIAAFPFHLAANLTMCQKIARDLDSTSLKVVCGIECRHCCQFRRFPKTIEEAESKLRSFRRHVKDECRGVPRDLRRYLSWMERWGLDESVRPAAEVIWNRLGEEERRRTNELKEERSLAEEKKESKKRKRRAAHSVLESGL